MMDSLNIQRQSLQVDIVCTGFGPAAGGFLTTLSRGLVKADGSPAFESRVAPGMPLQVVCYERADDISYGVSGVVTRARAIRESFPDLNPSDIPRAFPVKHEKVCYLLDPFGASKRPGVLRAMDKVMQSFKPVFKIQNSAFELPYIPPFLCKENGLLLSVGQFNQWVGAQLMSSGLIQIWPGMPVTEPLIQDKKVVGVRLLDQGTDKKGNHGANYTPGMDVFADLTVVGDGPVGAVGQHLDRHFGLPKGNHQREWAVGMKMVVRLPENCPLEAGTVLHTIGYPEPEIFGFFYVYPDRTASIGIFVPSWMDSPVRTSYRYLQYWMMHPYLWQYLKGGELCSWGAKSLQESGKRGEPFLAGDGYARIGEGSGSTNVLTGSGVDEAWATGTQLAEGVLGLLKEKKSFTKWNLEESYVARRRKSWVEKEGRIAEKARDGFQKSFIRGMAGMAITGITHGKINLPGDSKRPFERIPSLKDYYRGRISPDEVDRIREESIRTRTSMYEKFMERCGWPKIVYDGKLLISHQDALLLGGKVQAAEGYADHVIFNDPQICERCGTKVCIELCSAQAITPGEDGGVPDFDREKCVHCGACLWNCARQGADPERGNITFKAGAGGLHSVEN